MVAGMEEKMNGQVEKGANAVEIREIYIALEGLDKIIGDVTKLVEDLSVRLVAVRRETTEAKDELSKAMPSYNTPLSRHIQESTLRVSNVRDIISKVIYELEI